MGAAGNAGTSVAADKQLAKVKPRKRTPVAAPKGDVASSGGGYGLKKANKFKRTKRFQRDEAAAGEAAVAKALADAAHAKQLKHVKSHGSTLATVGSIAKVALPAVAGPGGLIAAPLRHTLKNIAIAGVEHPVAVTAHTAKGLRDSVLNIPGGLAMVATQSPTKTGKQIIADYVKRYGESDAAQRKRFVKEGLAPELLDATGAAAGGGATVGRALGAAARAGKLGDRAAELATAARPALRTTGGTARAQKLSPNFLKAVGQRTLDAKRATKNAKLVAKTSHELDERAPIHRVEAARANEAAGRTVEVAPLRGASKAQRVAVAKLKSRGVHLLRGEQHHRVEQVAHKALNQLSGPERDAFYYVASGQVPADATRAVEHLTKRRESILNHRAQNGTGTPRRRVDEVRKIDSLLKHPDKAFTPRLGQTVRDLRAQDVHVGRLDPGLRAGQRLLRRYSQQAEHLGLERGAVPVASGDGVPALRYGDEAVPAFIRRVQKAADQHGLERPLYFPSERDALDLNPDYASRAVGGAKAVAPPFHYTGKLYREGRQDTSPDVYLTGLARSIKRRHNWNLVADQFDRSTFKGLRNMPLGQLKSELTARGIDPKGVTFWNPGRFRKQLHHGELTAAEKPNRYGDATTPAEELDLERGGRVQDALAEATRSGTHAPSEELAATKGWAAIPKGAGDEIMASATGDGIGGRAYDVFRGKQARLLLGANPAWNAFQVLSNAGLGMAATKGALPLRMAQTERLYRSIDPEAQQLVDATIGEGAGSHGNQAKLGAAAKGRVTNKYRELKASPLLDKRILGGPTTRQLNPIEAGFALDRWQNSKFRKAVLIHSLKQEATRLDSATIKAMLKDPAKAEEHAKLMNDWLGDYTSYTARERKSLVRYPMFYGYLRHSTRLLFKTLPADHPLLLTAALYLGQMQRNELKKLGLDGLPWADGKYYYTTKGKVHEINLGRANPVANQLTSMKGWGQLLGFLPPFLQAIGNQIAAKDLYTGKHWDAYGKSGFGKPDAYFANARPRIFFEDMASGFAPYRTAEKMTMFGPQGDDSSLLLGKRPTEFKDKKSRKTAREQTAKDRQDASLLHQLMPLLPKVSKDPEIAKAMADRNKKKPRKRGGKSKAYFGQGSLGGGYGGSGSGNIYGGSSSGGLSP